MAEWIPNAIASLACLAIGLRLLLFRRRGRHQLGWSALAWLLINTSVAAAIIIVPALPVLAAWTIAVAATLIALRVFQCQGSVAKLWRLGTWQ